MLPPEKPQAPCIFDKLQKCRGVRGSFAPPYRKKKIAHGIASIKALAFLREMQKLGFIDRLCVHSPAAGREKMDG